MIPFKKTVRIAVAKVAKTFGRLCSGMPKLLASFATILIASVLLFAALTNPAAAQQAAGIDSDTAIEAGRDALRHEADFPWYDAESDGLERIEVQPQAPPPEIKQWDLKRKKGATTTAPGAGWRFSWATFFARALQYLAWAALAAIFIAGIYFGIRALIESDLELDDDEIIDETPRTDEDRMEQLPIDVRRPNADFLEEARRHYENQNYSEAIIYLFSYQLMQLDRNQWILLSKGKTNRQYLKEIHRRSERTSMSDLQKLSRHTMEMFEDSFFGHHSIDRSRFETCWNRLEDFHKWVLGGIAA